MAFELGIKIGADLSDFTAETAAANSILSKFGQSVVKNANDASKALGQIKNAGAGIAQSLGTIPKAFDAIAASSQAIDRINSSIDQSAAKAGNFREAGEQIADAISRIGASGAGIAQVTAAINDAALAAQRAGEGFLAIGVSKPIQDISVLRSNVEQLKKELASGFKPIVNFVDPSTPALLNSVSAALTNISPAVQSVATGFQNANNATQTFADRTLRSLQGFSSSVAGALSQLAAGASDITQVTAALNDAGIAAQRAGKGFLAIGVQAPIQDISILRANVNELKKDLASGFKPIIGVVDPSTGPLLNGISASLTNISPAIRDASGALKEAGTGVKIFSDSISRAVDGAVKDFQDFKKEANANLQIPTPNVPYLNLAARLPLQPLQNFNKELLTIRNTINSGFRPALDKISFSSANFSAINGTTNSLKKLKPEAQAASFALTDMSRVLQDLPFGFQGIANNITQLPGSFASLSAAAKASGQSISSVLLSTLTGPAGIGIALSAVTAAVTFASVGFGAWNRILGDTGDKVDEASEKAKEFVKNLKSIGDVRIESVGSVQGQIAEVQALASAVRDETKSQQERGRALDRLKEINKEYFGDLNLSKQGLDRLTTATNDYTKALVAQAVVKGFTDEITTLSTELRKQEGILERARDNYTRFSEALKNTPETDLSFKGEERISQAFVNAKDKAQSANEEFIKQRDIVDTLSGRFASLKGQLDKAVESTLKLPPLTGDGDQVKKIADEDKVLKDLNKTLEAYNKELSNFQEKRKLGILPTFQENDVFILRSQIQDILRQIDARELTLGLKPKLEIDPILDQAEFDKIENEFRQNLAVDKIVLPIDFTPDVKKETFFDKLKKAFETNELVNALAGVDLKLPLAIDPEVRSNVTETFNSIKGQFQELKFDSAFQPMVDSLKRSAEIAKNEIATIGAELVITVEEIKSSLVSSFSDLGQNLGAALGSGANPFVSAAQAILGVIGSVVQEFGKKVIELGVAMLAIKKGINLSFSNPAVAIAAGVALTALGAALKSIKFNVPKFAQGGIATGATLGIFGEAGPEAILPLDRINEFIDPAGGAFDIQVHGEISGYNLAIIQDRIQRRNDRFR